MHDEKCWFTTKANESQQTNSRECRRCIQCRIGFVVSFVVHNQRCSYESMIQEVLANDDKNSTYEHHLIHMPYLERVNKFRFDLPAAPKSFWLGAYIIPYWKEIAIRLDQADVHEKMFTFRMSNRLVKIFDAMSETSGTSSVSGM